MAPRHDLRPPAAPVAGLGVLDPPLAHAAPARSAPFRVAGRRVAVLGTGRRGVTASHVESILLTGPITLGPADAPSPAPAIAANVVQAPGLLRRELALAGVTLWETILVPERLAGFAVQWQTPHPGGLAGPPLELVVRVPVPLLAPPRWDARGGTLHITGAVGDESGCVLRLEPEADWTVEVQGTSLVARARSAGAGSEAMTLLVAALDRRGRAPSLKALAALEAHVRRACERSRPTTGVRTETGVAEIDEGVAWGRALLQDAVSGASPLPVTIPADTVAPSAPVQRLAAALLTPPAHVGWLVLGALAGGDPETARELLPSDLVHPMDALALAEWVAWTGEPGPLGHGHDALVHALADWESGAAADRRALLRVVRSRLGDALEAVGDTTRAEQVRSPAAPPSVRGRVRRLPTVGREAGGADLDEALVGALIGAVLGDVPEGAPGSAVLAALDALEAPTPALDVLLARARYALGRPDQAFPDLRTALGRPVRDGPPVSALLPATALWTLVTGLLGVRSDAAFGRLQLAPALPASWARFTLKGLTMGDTSLDVDYRREQGRQHWRFTPTAGAVPCTLIFEPFLSLAPPLTVRVDGRRADVEVASRGARTAVRLQLPLDSERSLTVDGS
jgi:hypothetical protein